LRLYNFFRTAAIIIWSQLRTIFKERKVYFQIFSLRFWESFADTGMTYIADSGLSVFKIKILWKIWNAFSALCEVKWRLHSIGTNQNEILQATRNTAPNGAFNHVSFSTSMRNEGTETIWRERKEFPYNIPWRHRGRLEAPIIWVGLMAGLDGRGEGKNLLNTRGLNPQTSGPYKPSYAIPAHLKM
jgi:hypothetical protein